MGLFSFIRDAFEQDATPAETVAPAPPTYDPLVRLVSQTFVGDLVSTNDVTYDDAWTRLYHLPIHSVAFLDSPAGWVVLAQQMGLSPNVRIH